MPKSPYDKVVDVCDKIGDTLDEIDTLINQVEAESDLLQLCRNFYHLRRVKDALEALGKKAGSTIDDMAKRAIPDMMESKDVRNITLDDIGYRFTKSARMFCSMPDKEKGMEWLEQNGAGDLIVPTVNAQTLSSWAKERLEVEGLDLPDDLFKVTTIPNTSMTKAK